jgi:hypothetical protein
MALLAPVHWNHCKFSVSSCSGNCRVKTPCQSLAPTCRNTWLGTFLFSHYFIWRGTTMVSEVSCISSESLSPWYFLSVRVHILLLKHWLPIWWPPAPLTTFHSCSHHGLILSEVISICSWKRRWRCLSASTDDLGVITLRLSIWLESLHCSYLRPAIRAAAYSQAFSWMEDILQK